MVSSYPPLFPPKSVPPLPGTVELYSTVDSQGQDFLSAFWEAIVDTSWLTLPTVAIQDSSASVAKS